MNFLAHLHLSYPHRSEMVGNFIGDFVKGRNYLSYPDDISRGIKLHRSIDSFTDTHPIHKKCRKLFADDYRLYSGVIVDMVFDHYLAKGWKEYNELKLKEFSQLSYKILEDHVLTLPERAQGILQKLKKSDRLASYETIEGLSEAISLMSRYTTLPDHTSNAIEIIIENSIYLENQFNIFYRELIKFVFNERLSNPKI